MQKDDKGDQEMNSEASKLNPLLKRVLHILSITGTFLMIFGFLFVVQMLLFGFIPIFKDIELLKIPISGVIFAITSVIIIIKFFKIGSPYKED